jgi:hypothetical protein
MRNVIVPVFVLVVVVAILAWLLSGGSPGQFLAALSALPLERQAAIAIAALGGLWLAGSVFWQAEQIARQGKAIKLLQERVDGVRQSLSHAVTEQHDADTALKVLADSDPDAAVALLSQRLKDAEQRTAGQDNRNNAVDMLDRVEDVRNRQKALRQQLGEVIEKRRNIEPVFAEITVRQEQLERSLVEIETDDTGGSVAERLDESGDRVMKTLARLKAAQERLATLARLKDEMITGQENVAPLQHAQAGIAATLGEVDALDRQLVANLEKLEGDGSQSLAARVEALLAGKGESDRRIADLNDQLATIQTLRDDVLALDRIQAQIARALAEAETDDGGRSLVDRLNEFNAFAAQARLRFEDLEASLAILNDVRGELTARHAALAPLQDSETGVRSMLGEVRFLHDRLTRILNDLELDGEKTLGGRVDELISSKREAHLRIAALTEAFTKLDTTRQEIGALFASLAATLNTYIAPSLEDHRPNEPG